MNGWGVWGEAHSWVPQPGAPGGRRWSDVSRPVGDGGRREGNPPSRYQDCSGYLTRDAQRRRIKRVELNRYAVGGGAYAVGQIQRA
jgi:hypothetical protein